MSIGSVYELLDRLELAGAHQTIAQELLKEIVGRLNFCAM